MIMPILIIVLSVSLIVSVIKWASYYYACCALMFYLETKYGEQLSGGDIKDILLERGWKRMAAEDWEQQSEKRKRRAELVTLIVSITAIILSVSVIVWTLSR